MLFNFVNRVGDKGYIDPACFYPIVTVIIYKILGIHYLYIVSTKNIPLQLSYHIVLLTFS